MSSPVPRMAQRMLSDADLAFIEATVDSAVPAPNQLRLLLAEDEEARARLLGSEALFQRVVALDDAFVRISPRLFFEVLLRRTVDDLRHMAHLVERAGNDRVPVFVSDETTRLASDPMIIEYLAAMLASFTRVQSHTLRVRVRRGIWRKARFSDLDVPSLLRLAQEVDESERMAVYRRAADASLLIIGVFPDFPATAVRYPGTGSLRARRGRLTTEEYEAIAERMYGLASRHPVAVETGLDEPLRVLSEHVIDVKRPLNHLAQRHLRFHRQMPFGYPWAG